MSASTDFGVEVHRTRRSLRRPQARKGSNVAFVLLGVGLAILTFIPGFVLGSLALGWSAPAARQNTSYGMLDTVPGVSFALAEASVVNSSTTPATGGCSVSDLGNATTPVGLANAEANPVCLSAASGGYAEGDVMYLLEVSWDSKASNATTYQVSVSVGVTPSTNDIQEVSYVRTSPTISPAEQAVYALDLFQAGDSSVTGFSVVVTQL